MELDDLQTRLDALNASPDAPAHLKTGVPICPFCKRVMEETFSHGQAMITLAFAFVLVGILLSIVNPNALILCVIGIALAASRKKLLKCSGCGAVFPRA